MGWGVRNPREVQSLAELIKEMENEQEQKEIVDKRNYDLLGLTELHNTQSKEQFKCRTWIHRAPAKTHTHTTNTVTQRQGLRACYHIVPTNVDKNPRLRTRGDTNIMGTGTP